ncbi:MAG: NAD-dependent epimerase/dehydratase family protein [Acidimicrobiales bacterium]|nr:NAD-dependent epimerase/dehydratase family protein [Acidimicrobiales bacterium]
MDVLVLGGTHHVGRSVVEVALARNHSVTTLTRGVSGPPASGAHPLYADRVDRAAIEEALSDRSWDVVVDTWSGPPCAVRGTASLLADRASQYCYVSSRSVYQRSGKRRFSGPGGRRASSPVPGTQVTATRICR